MIKSQPKVDNHIDDEEEIIQFDDNMNDDQQQKNVRQSDQFEPGRGEMNQFENQLPQLQRLATPAQQIKVQQNEVLNQQFQQQKYQQQQQLIQQQQKQEQEQQQFEENLKEESNVNSDFSDKDEQQKRIDVQNVSIVDFDHRASQFGGDSVIHDPQENVQPIQEDVFDHHNNDNNDNDHPPSSQEQRQINPNVSPFPPKFEIQMIKEMMEKFKRDFLITPLMKDRTLQCYIRRDKSGLAKLYPVYHVFTTDGNIYLFSAKKVVLNTTSNYVISSSKSVFSTRKDTYLGKVRSNFLGTEFQLFDDGINPKKTKDTTKIRAQLGIVYYESHIMANKGPRKMKVLLPKIGDQNFGKIFQPLNEKQGIQFDYQNGIIDYIDEYHNKPPRWDSKLKAHVLNFYGRVDQPSVKNFQLIHQGNLQYIYLQFGRVDDLTFNLDFCWPLSPLQAFEVCVTSFDFKFACE